MRRRPLLSLALAIVAASLFFGVRLALREHQREAAAEFAFQSLLAACARGTPIPENPLLDQLFEALLKNPYGRSRLQTLAERYPSVAFHAGKNAVFYLQEDSPHRDGSRDASLSSVEGHGPESKDGISMWSSAFPPSMILRKVALDGDQVVVDFDIAKTETRALVMEKRSFEVGASYTTRMAVDQVLIRPGGAADLYPLFFGGARPR